MIRTACSTRPACSTIAPVARRGSLRSHALSFFVGALAIACAPVSPPYARCGDGVGCAGSRCVELLYTLDDGSEAGGPFCSARCSTDADCPEDGVCVSVDEVAPLRFLCAPRCEVAGDCYAGLRCTELVGPGDVRAVCLPQ